MTTVITRTALGGAKNALTPMCVHIFTSPLDPETKAAARLALEVSLCLPVLLLEPLEAACRGVSSLNPERAFAFLSLSLSRWTYFSRPSARPDAPHLPNLGLCSFRKLSLTLVSSESISPFYEFLGESEVLL